MHKNLQKISAYIGFAKRSGAIIYGVDNFKKSVKLVIVSNDLSENSLKKARQSVEARVLTLDGEDMVSLFGEKIKAVAITNGDLANAIIKALENREETN